MSRVSSLNVVQAMNCTEPQMPACPMMLNNIYAIPSGHCTRSGPERTNTCTEGLHVHVRYIRLCMLHLGTWWSSVCNLTGGASVRLRFLLMDHFMMLTRSLMCPSPLCPPACSCCSCGAAERTAAAAPAASEWSQRSASGGVASKCTAFSVRVCAPCAALWPVGDRVRYRMACACGGLCEVRLPRRATTAGRNWRGSSLNWHDTRCRLG